MLAGTIVGTAAAEARLPAESLVVTVNAGVFGSPFGQAISVFNNSANVMYVVQGTSVTLRLAGTATTGTRSLARYGLASLVCVAANTFVISGAGIS